MWLIQFDLIWFYILKNLTVVEQTGKYDKDGHGFECFTLHRVKLTNHTHLWLLTPALGLFYTTEC